MNERKTSSTKPTVAVCMGTYNAAEYLEESIASALAQTYPIVGIWVSDDASSDETDARMRGLCAKYPQIRYHRQEKNLGPGGNLSWVLAQPEAEYIVRLDSDDRLEPKYIEKLVEAMERHPQAGFAHCDVWEMDGHGQRTRHRRLTRTFEFEDGDSMLRSNASGYRVAANCILYRKEAIHAVNYYQANEGWRTCEDWDMCLRMAAAGWGNVYVPETLTNYRVWDDPGGVRARRKISEATTNNLIFRNTLMPAYRKRGWSVHPLEVTMRRRAAAFCDALALPIFSPEEQAEYIRLLRELGDGPRLHTALLLWRLGLSPLIARWLRLKIAAKDAVKLIIRAARG